MVRWCQVAQVVRTGQVRSGDRSDEGQVTGGVRWLRWLRWSGGQDRSGDRWCQVAQVARWSGQVR